MDVVDMWTGQTACALQKALRMTSESFAARLGVAPRTVAKWHAAPGYTPRAEMQQILDTAYERADASVRHRFKSLIRPPEQLRAAALQVAIAVVVRAGHVLLVCRRDSEALSWQFPAGVVKPGASAATVAVQETRAETGVHCSVTDELGSRVHPETGVAASYFLCEHLAGEPSNLDQVENADVIWAPLSALTRFIPADRIYAPILTALEAHA